MDVKCPGRQQITTVFSHAQTVELCGNCNVMLCQHSESCEFFLSGCTLAGAAREWGVSAPLRP